MGDLGLILAVVVHAPDFLMASAGRGEVNVGAEQRCTAAEGDNVGGELMRDFTRAGLIDGAEVAFGNERCSVDVLGHVDYPAL